MNEVKELENREDSEFEGEGMEITPLELANDGGDGRATLTIVISVCA